MVVPDGWRDINATYCNILLLTFVHVCLSNESKVWGKCILITVLLNYST